MGVWPLFENYITDEVVKIVALAYEFGFAVLNEYFGGTEAAVEIAAHFETIGPGVEESEVIALAYFVELAVPGEGVGFANIANHGVNALGTVGVADVFDEMIAFVKHGAYEVVETAVDTCKNGGGSGFYNVGVYHKITRFANEVFTGLEPNLQVLAGFALESFEGGGYFLPEAVYIGFQIIFAIGYFKTTAEVDYFEAV